jgi:hypothetical protein
MLDSRTVDGVGRVESCAACFAGLRFAEPGTSVAMSRDTAGTSARATITLAGFDLSQEPDG